MDASIDTDIVIHLYGCRNEELIFHLFDEMYKHAYLYEFERRAPWLLKKVFKTKPTDFNMKTKKAVLEFNSLQFGP